MSYTYAVPKRKYNRLSYRFLGTVFVIVAVLQFIILLKGYSDHMMLTTIFVTALGGYGIYLIYYSLRKQAFDMTYKFDETGMCVTHKYGETKYTFEDIEFITMIVADQEGMFYILNIKAKKDVYIIPFTMKKDYCETIYEFVNARIKKD